MVTKLKQITERVLYGPNAHLAGSDAELQWRRNDGAMVNIVWAGVGALVLSFAVFVILPMVAIHYQPGLAPYQPYLAGLSALSSICLFHRFKLAFVCKSQS